MVASTQAIAHPPHTNDTIDINSIVEEDHRLEAQESNASKALMQYRWHWTLDESNPQRLGFRAYGDAVGRSHVTIQQYAKGYLLLTSNGRGAPTTPEDARRRAIITEDTEVAIKAVASERGLSFDAVHRDYRFEAGRVRDEAREQAQKHNTTVSDEAPQIAKRIREQDEEIKRIAEEQQREQQEQERKRQQEQQRAQRHGIRCMSVEQKIVEAQRHLAQARSDILSAIKESEGVSYTKEELDYLSDTFKRYSLTKGSLTEADSSFDQVVLGNHVPNWGTKLQVVSERKLGDD